MLVVYVLKKNTNLAVKSIVFDQVLSWQKNQPSRQDSNSFLDNWIESWPNWAWVIRANYKIYSFYRLLTI